MTPPPGPLRTKLDELFGIDARSLALFRIGLALVVFADLGSRLPDLVAHYTDQGVLPRAALAEQVSTSMPWAPYLLRLNPHFLFGGALGQGLLFALAAALAVLMAVGWRTRLATVASWVLLASLHGRNPALLNFGDVVLRLLLFWAMFLPLGAQLSLDARRAERAGRAPPRTVTGGATAALLVQVVFIYWFNVLLKEGPGWSGEYTALEHALQIDAWAAPLGTALLAFPGLLKLGSWLVIGLERVGPLLAFAPVANGPLRTLAVALFWTFHLAIAVTMRIGIFPYVCMVAWLAFLPGWFWQQAGRRFGRRPRPDGGLARLRPAVSAAALLLLAYVFLWNLHTVKRWRHLLPRPLKPVGYLLRLDQRWAMFAPSPPLFDVWCVAKGESASGRIVDLLGGGPPASPAETGPPAGPFGRVRWRVYLRYTVETASRTELPALLGAYLARRWDRAHPAEERLRSVRVYQARERITVGRARPPAAGAPGRVTSEIFSAELE